METTQYTPEEQAEHRAALVAALRSGEYAQGQHRLKTEGIAEDDKPEYCCLGVACDISGLGTWDRVDGYVIFEGSESSTTHLPGAVQRWLGFHTDNGALDETIPTPADCASVLTDANDDGVTFAEIADLIEAGKVRTV